MRIAELIVAMSLIASPVFAQSLTVPSGQPVTLHDVMIEATDQASSYRFRFLTPDIAGSDVLQDIDVLEGDMVHLCQILALPQIAEGGDIAGRVIISFADRPTEFGVATPEATQIFESYSIENDTCIWEAF